MRAYTAGVMSRLAAIGLAWALAGSSIPGLASAGRPAGTQSDPVHRAFAEYARGDREAIARLVQTVRGDGLRRQIDAAVRQWSQSPQRLHATFLLELAFARSDMFDVARKFVTSRPDVPGADPAEDEFELAWHKTSIAFLQNQRRPDILERAGTDPLKSRHMGPWGLLAVAITEEQWIDNEPWNLDARGPSSTTRARSAAKLFEDAAQFAAVQGEALVRLSRVYLHLGRPMDAIAALDRIDRVGGGLDDRTLRYWAHLFRGRASEALGRLDEAARAYADALALIPGAQVPATALAALERRRGRAAEAERWAVRALEATSPGSDPWHQYATGEFRFFSKRLETLRRMAMHEHR